MDRIKKYIYQQVATKKLSSDEATTMLLELQSMNQVENDIAIVGMACRYPGAKNPDEFWNNIKNKVNSITKFSNKRRKDTDYLLLEHFPNATPEEIENFYNQGGFLEELDKFDPAFFRISPREAKLMDPLQRMLLETYYEAMEDGGYGGNRLYGSMTGVFVGKDHTYNTGYQKVLEDNDDTLAATGSWAGILSGRVSYVFNFSGPSEVIDTACSSGLVAIHEACQALKNNECEYALAGGIHLITLPSKDQELSLVESQDFVVRSFDKNANGTVWGEGVGAVLLKPLSKAISDGDHIHAVIKASAINNDGTTNGITAPSAEAQEAVILKSWKGAKINPETIQYIETHATGTVLGDPIEVKGLTNAFKKYTDKKQFCGIGSVKPNIGHLVAAAGVSSLFKVVLALKNKILPPSINIEEPNEYINFLESPIYVNDKLKDWKQGNEPRRAGVSAFGFSGTNCHLVLEEAPEYKKDLEEKELKTQILTISARNKETLKVYLKKYKDFFETDPEFQIKDLCYTANTGRGHYFNRLVILANGVEELREKIKKLNQMDFESTKEKWFYYGEHKIITSSKKVKEAGEILEEERRTFSKIANQKLKEFVENKEEDTTSLDEICQLYVAGADIEWTELYAKQKNKKVSLPIYPLERLRFWPKPKTKKKVAKMFSKEIEHPLIDQCLVDSIYQDIFVTTFSVDRHWVLSDHKVMGRNVLPGTAYLEMAREACRKHYPDGRVQIKDVVFLTPLMVNEEEVKEVQTILKKEENHLEFTIASKNVEDHWVKHVIGRISQFEDGIIPEWNLEDLKKGFDELVPLGDDGIAMPEESKEFQFGPRWAIPIKGSLNSENTEVLVELKLPVKFDGDLKEYTLHPSLLDQAVNVAIRSIGKGLYLPLSYKSLKVYSPMTERFYCYIKTKGEFKKDAEIASFDITMLDASGKLIVEIGDYSIKKVRGAALKFAGEANIHLGLHWTSQELIADDVVTHTQGTTLVFKDQKGIATEVIQRLRTQNRKVIEVEMGSEYRKIDTDQYLISGKEEDYKNLIAEVKERGLTQILHMQTITDNEEVNDIVELFELQNRGVYSLFYLMRALSDRKFNQNLEIFLISDYVNSVTRIEKTIKPHQASLFGLGKVIGDEYSKLICRSIDIDDNTPIDQIISELDAKTQIYQVAYREGKRYVQELGKVDIEEFENREVQIKEEGVYIVTGGTGGLGLEMAKHLSKKGKINLALLNRSRLPERKEWETILASDEMSKVSQKIKVIREIEELGASVSCYAANISKLEEVKPVIDELRVKYGRINGVIHSAGVAGDGFIILKEKEKFDDVLLPKIQGTWILDKLTRVDNLDFFVMFSSITAIMGGPGQGDYTAANAYLDSYAAYREKLGFETLSINWTAWKETGMAVDYEVDFNNEIFKAISTERALHAFDQVLHKKISNTVIGELNYKSPAFNHVEHFPIRLSSGIKHEIKKYQLRLTGGTGEKTQEIKLSEVKISGRSNGDYTETETKLAKIWSAALDLSEISIYDDLYDLGGDSILTIKISNLITEYMKIQVEVSDLFKYLTIAELAQYIEGVDRENESPVTLIMQVEEREYYPLSSAQSRMYILDKLENIGTAYNLSIAFKVGSLDQERLKRAFQELIYRHEALRTTFEFIDGEPVQKIHNNVEARVEYLEGVEDVQEVINQFIRPFNLAEAPLCRVGFVRGTDNQHLIILDTHHIISDGTTIFILIDEFMKLYEGKILQPLKIQYKDYAVWQNQMLQSAKMKEKEKYWMSVFANEVPVLNLPTDYPRPAEMGFEGAQIDFEIEKDVADQLKKLATRSGATLYMALLAAYNVLLSNYAGQEDIIIGSPVAGRYHIDLENVVGMFVNTLALRNRLESQKTFKQFLEDVKENMLKVYANQEYQFEHLVKKLDLKRDLTRNPLFDVMFVLQNLDDISRNISRSDVAENENKSKTANFDLTLTVVEREDGLSCNIEYRTYLFKKETIVRMTGHFVNIIAEIVKDPEQEILSIDMLSKEEKDQLICVFNDTDVAFPKDKTIHQFFEEQVEQTPEEIAVVFGDNRLTYRQLNEKSNQLARVLRDQGLKPDQIVGIMVEPSLEMVIGIMGVIKAGGAYLPIDSEYSESRIQFMLTDSNTRLLLTQSQLAKHVQFAGEMIYLDAEQLYTGDFSNLDMVNQLSDLVYVIYTSGTTGKPKGVMIEHHSLTNLTLWHHNEYEITAEDRSTKYAGFGFDASVWEIFPYLVAGATIFIIPDEIRLDVRKLNDFFEVNQITISFLPTQLCEHFMELDNTSLRILLTGGDKLKNYSDKKYQLVNNYGPTENTVVTTNFVVERAYTNIPIGKPIANTQVYILDQKNQLLPIGVIGELCISGESLARGYLNQPTLTEEKFVPNSFVQGSQMYRTGDLARWLPDGNIEFLGRIDNQVKIRGYRIELGEVETQLMNITGITEAIVADKEDSNGQKYLAGYIISDIELSIEVLRTELAKVLPGYMIPSYFVRMDELPLTPNGKVDRKALPEPDRNIAVGPEYVAPENEMQEKLAWIWSNILGVEKVGIHDNFFDLGGHSLKGAELVSLVHKECKIEMTLKDLFQAPTIAQLSIILQKSGSYDYQEIQKIPEKEFYELSYSQKRLFIANQMHPDSKAYNMPSYVTLHEEVNEEIIRIIIEKIVKRHEGLRTTFKVIEGRPAQVIHPESSVQARVKLEVIDLSQLSDEERLITREDVLKNEIAKPFDLITGPLVRVTLVKVKRDEFDLIFTMHHIISDGASIEILKKEFASSYDQYKKGREMNLEPLKFQYKDFAAWQNHLLSDSEKMDEANKFWSHQLRESLPFLNLPTDKPYENITHRGSAAYRIVVSEDILKGLKIIGKEYNASLFVVLLAGWYQFLNHLTGQEDILMGMPVSGREHDNLKNVIGFFINTIILRFKVDPAESFSQLLPRVQNHTLTVLEYQSYPLEIILEELEINYPKIPVFFNMLNLGDLNQQYLDNLESYHIEQVQEVKFDIVCYLTEYLNGIEISCHYLRDLFEPTTIEFLMEEYILVLESICENPDITVEDLDE